MLLKLKVKYITYLYWLIFTIISRYKLLVNRISDFQDIILDNIPYSYNNRYALDFWIKIENIGNLEQTSINIIYSKHIAISIFKDETSNDLNVACFPQEFLISPNSFYSSKDILNLLNKSNYSLYNINTFYKLYLGLESIWFFNVCAYSYNNEEFYLNSENNIQKIEKNILYNNVYYEDVFQYYPPINKYSYLTVQNISLINNSNCFVYLQTLRLYNDYIPQSFYDINLTNSLRNISFNNVISSYNTFKELLFNIDFNISNTDRLAVEYKVQDTVFSKSTLTHYLRNTLKVKPNSDINNNFSSNDVVLCDSNNSKYYNSGTCDDLLSCDSTTTNYCFDNNKAYSCKDNYFLDVINYSCSSDCNLTSTGYIRSPGSSLLSSLCNFKCPIGSLNCNNINSSNLQSSLKNSFKCDNNNNYFEFNYKCYLKSSYKLANDISFYSSSNYLFKKEDFSFEFNNSKQDYTDNKNTKSTSNLLLSSCLRFPKIKYTIKSSNLKKEINFGGYIIEAWFKPEYVYNRCNREYYLFNKESTISPENLKSMLYSKKNYYFLLGSHELYETSINNFYYDNKNIENYFPDKILSINLYNWNQIFIEVKLPLIDDDNNSDNSSYIKIYSNYKLTNSSSSNVIVIDKIKNALFNLYFESITFDPDIWGSAFYSKLRIWDLKFTSVNAIQYNTLNMNSLNVLNYLKFTSKSLYMHYEFNAITAYIDNKIINLVDDSESIKIDENIEYYINSSSGDSIEVNNSNVDKLFYFNFSTNHDYKSLLHNQFTTIPNFFSYSNNVANKVSLSFNNCIDNCLYCNNNSIYDCLICNESYSHIEDACYINNYYYLSSISKNSQNNLDLNIGLNSFYSSNNYKGAITITFWIKIIDIVIGNTKDNSCINIITFNANDMSNICIYYLSYNNSSLNFYIKDKTTNTVFSSLNLMHLNTNLASYDLLNIKNKINILGIWTLISVSSINIKNYKELKSKFPAMFNFYINDIQININNKTVSDDSSLDIKSYIIHKEVAALYSDIRIYNTILINPYGVITNKKVSQTYLINNVLLYSSDINSCLKQDQILDSDISISNISCISDYNPFLDFNKLCNNTNNVLEINKMISHSDNSECKGNFY